LILEEKKGDPQRWVYPNGVVYFSKDDSQPAKRVVTATGVVDGSQRSIQIEFPAKAPEVFNHALSVKGDIEIKGHKVTLALNDKIRLSGRLTNTAKHSSAYVEDLKENLSEDFVSLKYPDANANGVMDEFDDFLAFNRDLVNTYPAEEVLYIKGDDTYTLNPQPLLEQKKRIVYVEGSAPEKGSVVVLDSGIEEERADQQNLTVIATGQVSFNQMGSAKNPTPINIIAWSGYREIAVLSGIRKGVTYTHGKAEFDEIGATSITQGSVIANDGVIIKEVWSTKAFHYADPRQEGLLPPGFEGLIGSKSAGYESRSHAWREI